MLALQENSKKYGQKGPPTTLNGQVVRNTKKVPVNQYKREEHEDKQKIIRAIQREDKVSWVKKMYQLKKWESNQERLQAENRARINARVKYTVQQIQHFQENHSIDKAAIAIKIFEKYMGSKVDMKKIR